MNGTPRIRMALPPRASAEKPSAGPPSAKQRGALGEFYLGQLHAQLAWRNREVFLVVFLDECLDVIASEIMFNGDAASVLVNLKQVATEALRHGAASILVAHNHPFGGPAPSERDVQFTKKLRVVMTLACVAVHDHVIVSRDRVHSMAKQGPWAAPLDELAAFIADPNELQTPAKEASPWRA